VPETTLIVKVISRIKGGLGNQLFCYAAARRLALVNDAELVIDDITGFVRDSFYHRRYMLDQFHIPVRKATSGERFEPFERYRRGLAKLINQSRSFHQRSYLEQEGVVFDHRLFDFKVNGTVYIDGYWQSELYFKDVAEVIRQDLRIVPPSDSANQSLAEEIRASLAVAIHVRWFNTPGESAQHNVAVDYYRRAVVAMEGRLSKPYYYIFSDNPDAARTKLMLPESRTTFVSHNREDEYAYADLWLMSQCKHFIIANSTFSWWGAWLGEKEGTIVICPSYFIGEGNITAWNFTGQIPERWLKI
jgi:hypothetical protein